MYQAGGPECARAMSEEKDGQGQDCNRAGGPHWLTNLFCLACPVFVCLFVLMELVVSSEKAALGLRVLKFPSNKITLCFSVCDYIF